MKSVLMILNYFYPDVASTSQLFTELCGELCDEFEITVIATVPSYTGLEAIKQSSRIECDKYKNIKVIRIPAIKVDKTSKISRIRYISNYFFYALRIALKEKRTDIVFTISQPPILGGLLGVITKLFKRNKLIYCIEDFNPEQIEAVKYSKNKVLIDFARFLDNISCKYSDKVVVVGHDMQKTLFNRIKRFKSEKSVVINNWINEKEIYSLDKVDKKVAEFLKNNNLQDKFIIMYSGNLGLYYDLENLVKVIEEFKCYNDIAFVFIGEGATKKKLEQYVVENKMTNVKFLPYQPKEELIYSLNAADVHLVTNAKGIKGVSVPSKIYGVMATGKPIFGILEKGSEAQRLIELSNCGIISEPSDYSDIKSKFKYILDNRDEFIEKGKKGRVYLEKNLSMKKSIDKYRELFNSIKINKNS